jgi:hypothetical protein
MTSDEGNTEMSDSITRRDAIKRSAAVVAGMTALGGVAIGDEVVEPVVIPTLDPITAEAARNDVTVAIRNWFVNRCPVLTRFNWIPVERVDFLMHSHRYARPGELAGVSTAVHPAFGARGLVTVGESIQQFCQTFQFCVTAGPSPQGMPSHILLGGVQTPFDFNMTMQLQNLVDDLEMNLYYGVAQRPSPYSSEEQITAKMVGLFGIIRTNNFRQPANADAYRFEDFTRDTIDAARANGGAPDTLLVATNFMSGFATWGIPLERRMIGETVFGTPIHAFRCSGLPGTTIVEAPLFRPYTAAALTSGEVRVRNKRNPCFVRRPNRNDPVEGDWIFEGAIDVVNEAHHAAVSGIERFGA